MYEDQDQKYHLIPPDDALSQHTLLAQSPVLEKSKAAFGQWLQIRDLRVEVTPPVEYSQCPWI